MSFSWIKKKFSTSIIAHRGFSELYPENTLLAFEKALEMGADYCELDIDFSSDGIIVVIHDDTTGRVADRDLVVTKTELKSLKSLILAQDQKIPTLEEVFDLCKGKIGLNIEIKGNNMAEALNKVIKAHQMEKNVLISSFDHNEIIDLHRINPELKIATLEPSGSKILSMIRNVLNQSKLIHNADVANADAIHPFVLLASKSFIKRAHKAGYAVNIWTSDPKQWARLVKHGVDGICTNNPAKLKSFLEQNAT